MGANTARTADPRARQLAQEGIRQRRNAIASRPEMPPEARPVNTPPGLGAEIVRNPGFESPTPGTNLESFQRLLSGARSMR